MEQAYRTVGLMSGSSLDGVDMVCCDLSKKGEMWKYHMLAAETIPYPENWQKRLLSAHIASGDELKNLDADLGAFFGRLLIQFMEKHRVVPGLISSHGHTVIHEPDRGITFQAGSGQTIADMTRTRVVSDFRKEDVDQGGQGAPLVPVGDQLLFRRFGGCLNLGGIANISFDDAGGRRVAFDICPANMALNWLAGLKGLDMDRDGKLAGSGTSDPRLINALNALDFYQAPPPKSLGREWFLSQFLPLIQKADLSLEDRMATVVEHTAMQTGKVIDAQGLRSVLVTGGGALNRVLMERLQSRTRAEVVVPEERLIHYKEAIIFALLGVLKVRNEINCLSSVTGGRKDLSAGTVYDPAGDNEPLNDD